MTLEVALQHRMGNFSLDVSFESQGELTALFGGSGAGKTTVVNAIAGLLRPNSGRIAVDGRTVLDIGRGVFVPPHRRRLGYVFQEGRLFPHLTVKQNLLYGRWFAPRAERTADFGRVAGMLGLETLLERRPLALSGGEKQRVAIGRALLASPRLLLMDEPLASLDDPRKAEILPYVERLRDEAKVPIVYVSHSVAEVARLATTVVLLDDGKVAAIGSVSEVMGRIDLFPLTGAQEAGAVLDAHVAAHDAPAGLTRLDSTAGPIRVPLFDGPVGAHLRLRIRARDVILALAPPTGISALNVLAGAVTAVEAGAGPLATVGIDCSGAPLLARLTRKSVADLGLAPGIRVYAIVKSVAFESRGIGRFGETKTVVESADS